ncbi:MAG: tetratricopeptide repeat protein [Synergistes sp.]|nr:tetratricopeptide repeat protein [Synergistes sp.]
MKKSKGSIMTFFVIVIVLVLLAATAWLAVAAIQRRNAQIGRDFLKSGDYTHAAEYLEKANRFSLRPDAELIYSLAEARLGLGETEEAKTLFKEVVSIERGNIGAHYELGKIYVSEKNFGDAKNEISALKEIGSEKALSYAAELEDSMQSDAIKDAVEGLINKILPNGVSNFFKKMMPENGSKDVSQPSGSMSSDVIGSGDISADHDSDLQSGTEKGLVQ